MRYVMLNATFPGHSQNERPFVKDGYYGFWFPYKESLEPIKIRDRLGAGTRGSGPFFGANVSPASADFLLGREKKWGPNGDRVHYLTYYSLTRAYPQDTVKQYYLLYADGSVVLYGYLMPSFESGNKVYAGFNCALWRNYPDDTVRYSVTFSLINYRWIGVDDMISMLHAVTSVDTIAWFGNQAGWLPSQYRQLLKDNCLARMGIDPGYVASGANFDAYREFKSSLWSDNLREYTGVKIPNDVIEQQNRAQFYLDMGFMTNRDASGFASALENAVENMPESMVNTAENVLDVCEGLLTLGAGLAKAITGDTSGLFQIPKHIDVFKSAAEAWLAYRYVYTTSKSDLEEYAELTSRLIDIMDLPRVTCHGTFVDGDREYRCSMIIDTEPFMPKDLKGWAKTYGVRVSSANYWDMLPYSFVVDWFTGIGNLLSWLDSSGRMVPFRSKECWYSLKCDYKCANTYSRFPDSAIPVSMPRLTLHKAKKSTLLKRFADGICLIGG